MNHLTAINELSQATDLKVVRLFDNDRGVIGDRYPVITVVNGQSKTFNVSPEEFDHVLEQFQSDPEWFVQPSLFTDHSFIAKRKMSFQETLDREALFHATCPADDIQWPF